MPAREEAGTPTGHSLALFSEGHTSRNEVNRALALVADLGAATDVHRFRFSLRRKQELFTRMHDLDITWNDWLAEAEGIDLRLRLSNITSHIYPFLPQPLPRGLDMYHITKPGSNDRRFQAHLDHLDSLAPLPIPPRPREDALARDPPLQCPALHDEELWDAICLYCNEGHTAHLCPRPHVLCGKHSMRCHVLVHHPRFGAPCPARII
ncbi:hypothetical protein EDB87DRAFT_1580440 [Lactarius vividus]|nr:hypothetical protein EDB87DRAFT_1580440 [Lactarius vividus]